MKLKITHTAPGKPIRCGELIPVNTTRDGMSATLTTRYEAIGPTNILSLAHYPMTVAMIRYNETDI